MFKKFIRIGVVSLTILGWLAGSVVFSQTKSFNLNVTDANVWYDTGIDVNNGCEILAKIKNIIRWEDVISINSNGELQVSWENSIQTPYGTFSAEVSSNLSELYSDRNGVLIVNVDGINTVYNLNGQDNITVTLESGYYRQVELRKAGNNWYFEAQRILSNSAAGSSSSNVDILEYVFANQIKTSNPAAWCIPSSVSCNEPNYAEVTIHNNSQYDLSLYHEEGCYFDSYSNTSKRNQRNLNAGEQVVVICPLVYYAGNGRHTIEIMFLYPQSGSNQASLIGMFDYDMK